MTQSGWYDPQEPPPQPRSAGRRPRWLRRIALAVVGGFVLVVVQHSPLGDWSVGERSLRDLSIGDLLGGDGDPDPESYEAEWQTLDGSSYRMTVTPSSSPRDEASREPGAWAPPDEGRDQPRIRGPHREPLRMRDADARGALRRQRVAWGELDRSAEAQAGTNRAIEVSPRGPGCPATTPRPSGRPGGRTSRRGRPSRSTARWVASSRPCPTGWTLLIRYIQVDEPHPEPASTAGLRAPSPRRGVARPCPNPVGTTTWTTRRSLAGTTARASRAPHHPQAGLGRPGDASGAGRGHHELRSARQAGTHGPAPLGQGGHSARRDRPRPRSRPPAGLLDSSSWAASDGGSCSPWGPSWCSCSWRWSSRRDDGEGGRGARPRRPAARPTAVTGRDRMARGTGSR